MSPENVKLELIKKYPLTFREPGFREEYHMNGLYRRDVVSIAESGDMVWKLLKPYSDEGYVCYIAMREYNGKDWVEIGFPTGSIDFAMKHITEDWEREIDRITAYVADFVGSSEIQPS